MQVLIRTDASLKIGTGHVFRCLTLADSLKSKGVDCKFICREHEGNLINIIRDRGFSVESLSVSSTKLIQKGCANTLHGSSNYDHWLGVAQEEDASQCINVLGDQKFDWIIVDHYGIGQEWESVMRAITNKIFVIDDLADRKHDCDLLLDQNLGRLQADYTSQVPQTCRLLIGPNFALLRPEFADARLNNSNRKSRDGIHRILISMGGVDLDNTTKKVLDALWQASHLLPSDCLIQIVMGAKAPWLEQIKSLSTQFPLACEVLVNVNNMAVIMSQADLAIGAVGGTAWERCSLGLPTLAIVLAENQRMGAESLAALGAIGILPQGSKMADVLISHLHALSKDSGLNKMQKASSKVTDGRGTEKITNILIGGIDSSIETFRSIRPMSHEDLLMVRKWRNHPDIKKYMNSQHEISESEHLQWFESALIDPKRNLLIYEENNIPLGFVQFSIQGVNGEAVWGFYLDPEVSRGKGYQLGKVALSHAFKTLNLPEVYGEVFATNGRSIGFHNKLGFQLSEIQLDEQVLLVLSKSRWLEINKGEING